MDETLSLELFELPESGPLAHRLRPLKLGAFQGQEQILGPGKPLRTWIETDRIPSLIFWGPPGCGKTTLARIIAHTTQSRFESISAVHGGVREIKEAAERAKKERVLLNRKSILFVDEIHRFNRSQQDALLPHVEDGTFTLIGATTENPSFELNTALLSRTRVIRFGLLSEDALNRILDHALHDPAVGLKNTLSISSEARSWLISSAEGDARRLLTTLETLSLSDRPHGILSLDDTKQALESALERQPIPYDKSGEEHYNIISAFIKSIRDSDPHAGLYYLARMIEGGEDPLFIARRLVIFASEDIGNADPRALQIAIAVKDAVEFVGMPEARINLAQGVTYLALAPKSNASYVGISEAIAEVRRSGALPCPLHLRNPQTPLMRAEGYGKGYQYAHDSNPKTPGRVKQTHLPDSLLGKTYYRPTENGLEKQIKEKLDRINPDFLPSDR